MPRDGRQMVIDLHTATAVRGQVGPIGWLVVEAIAAHAPPSRGIVEARCSSRSLARSIGVSKDSVARALRSLTEAGVVMRVDHRDEFSGRFESTTYRVALASVGITVTTVSQPTATTPHATVPEQTDPHTATDQLSLLA